MGPLPDEGTTDYIKITPLHLAARYSFLGVLRTEFDSALTGLSTEGEDLNDLAQDIAAEADDVFCRIRARGACFLPLELVGDLYKLGERLTIAKVSPQLFASVLALSLDTPAYANVLDWVQASFNKVFRKNPPTLSYLEGPIWTSWSWVPSYFEVNSLEGRQESEFIRGRLPGCYGAPLAPGDTTSARAAPTSEASTHAARDGAHAQVLWGNDPRAHLGDNDIRTRYPPVLSPFRQGFETFAAISDSG